MLVTLLPNGTAKEESFRTSQVPAFRKSKGPVVQLLLKIWDIMLAGLPDRPPSVKAELSFESYHQRPQRLLLS